MTTYYLIKATAKATDENPSFAGDVHVYYHGKGDEVLCRTGDGEIWPFRRYMNKYLIREYGYTRKCDAVRNFTYNNPQNDKNWTETTEIITCKI